MHRRLPPTPPVFLIFLEFFKTKVQAIGSTACREMKFRRISHLRTIHYQITPVTPAVVLLVVSKQECLLATHRYKVGIRVGIIRMLISCHELQLPLQCQPKRYRVYASWSGRRRSAGNNQSAPNMLLSPIFASHREKFHIKTGHTWFDMYSTQDFDAKLLEIDDFFVEFAPFVITRVHRKTSLAEQVPELAPPTLSEQMVDASEL